MVAAIPDVENRSSTPLLVDLQVACDAPDLPDEEVIDRLLHAALAAAEATAHEVEVSVRVVDEDEIRLLNREYRQQDRPTNVLSFPAALDELPGLPDDDLGLLGDVVICASVVAREAAEQGKPASAHWSHLLVHGFLHLLGFDHVEDDDAERMEALEIEVLTGLGLENPYEDRHLN